MAYQFIQLLKKDNIEYYVAPYEADAQLAYMYLKGRAQVIITEDSDLLIFGAKKVFFKMDMNGNGIEVDIDRLREVEEINFRTFTQDMLLVTCILSGCDYLNSIKGIGFKKAHKLVYETGDNIQNILKKLRREGKHLIPANYEQMFEKAFLTFKFQLVYCPDKRQLVHLHDPEEHQYGKLLQNYPSLVFLGRPLEEKIA